MTVVPRPHHALVHHPWRRLRDHLPDWQVVFTAAPATGALGATDSLQQLIRLDERQHQRQRRCTLDHELIHAESGDEGHQDARREAEVSRQSARRLITLAQLVDAALWAHDIEELADECWVDVETMQCRLDNLTDVERTEVRQAIAIRDFHEEGMT